MSNKKEYSGEEFVKDFCESSTNYGFWYEITKRSIKRAIETTYVTEIIRDMFVEDVIMDGEKVLIRWSKRSIPLTDEEIKEKYGREV